MHVVTRSVKPRPNFIYNVELPLPKVDNCKQKLPWCPVLLLWCPLQSSNTNFPHRRAP